MDLFNCFLNLVVPPASMLMLAFAWPTLCFIRSCEWLYNTFYCHDMDGRVVIITGASSSIGEANVLVVKKCGLRGANPVENIHWFEINGLGVFSLNFKHIAYEYAKRRALLVLVARREERLRAISKKARHIGAKNVIVIAADVVKEEDCRRFVSESINSYGRVDHLVNAVSLGHTFYFEEVIDTSMFPHLLDINFWGNIYPTFVALPHLHRSNGRIIVNASVENWLPLPRMSLYAAAKAALVNFYETLRLEVKDIVGITIATHGWIGGEMTRGKFMLEEGAEMQWKEEREVQASGGTVEEYARLIVSGACRGDAYVKYPSWHDAFLLYRVFAPNVLNWACQLLPSAHGTRRTSMAGVVRPLSEGITRNVLEATSPRKLPAGPITFSSQQKME